MPLSYEVLTDNLMDLSHVAFTHATILGNHTLVPVETAVRHEGRSIWSDRVGRNGAPQPVFADSGACPPDEKGAELSRVQILTPASADLTYYFVKHFRDYKRDDDAMTLGIANAVVYAFETEDEPMIARVTQNMKGREFWSMRPVILPCDAGAVRVRRLREKMIRDEQHGEAEATPVALAAG